MFVANGSPVTRQTLRQRGGTGEDGHIYLAGWTLSVAAINKKKNYLTSKNEFRFFFFPPLFATLRDYPHTHTYTHTHTAIGRPSLSTVKQAALAHETSTEYILQLLRCTVGTLSLIHI